MTTPFTAPPIALSRKDLLTRYFMTGVSAVDPLRLTPSVLRHDAHVVSLSVAWAPEPIPRKRLKRVFVVGAGKAARVMADAVLRTMGDLVTEGVVVAPKGCGGALGPIKCIEASSTAPDIGSLAAVYEILALLEKAGEDDLVIALFSSGGSAMISSPVDGITAREKTDMSRLMMQAGVDAHSFDTVCKHISKVKGGMLARAAHPATVWALLLSNISGDDPSEIASGPFAPDPTTYADVIGVLERYGLLYSTPMSLRQHFLEGADDRLRDTPKPSDPIFKNVFHAFLGTNRTAMAAISEAAKKDGAQVLLLPGFLRGEAHDCARAFCDRMRAAAASLAPRRTAVLIAGGETTVNVWGNGSGGRSQEFALAAAMKISGVRELAVLAGTTDGVDGPTNAAGAYADGSTITRAKACGLDPRAHLLDNNSHTFFKTLGDLIVTGETGTNVADLVIGLAHSPA